MNIQYCSHHQKSNHSCILYRMTWLALSIYWWIAEIIFIWIDYFLLIIILLTNTGYFVYCVNLELKTGSFSLPTSGVITCNAGPCELNSSRGYTLQWRTMLLSQTYCSTKAEVFVVFPDKVRHHNTMEPNYFKQTLHVFVMQKREFITMAACCCNKENAYLMCQSKVRQITACMPVSTYACILVCL